MLSISLVLESNECDRVTFPFRGITIVILFTWTDGLKDMAGSLLSVGRRTCAVRSDMYQYYVCGWFLGKCHSLHYLQVLFACSVHACSLDKILSSSSFHFLWADFLLILPLSKQKKQDPKPDGTTKTSEDELTCSICLEQVNMGDLIRSLPCLHQVTAFLCMSMIKMPLKREAILPQIILIVYAASLFIFLEVFCRKTNQHWFLFLSLGQ